MRHRCEWCGKFFSSPLPDAFGCKNHIAEHNAKMQRSIDEHNRKLAQRLAPPGASDAH